MRLRNWRQSDGWTYRWLAPFGEAQLWAFFRKIYLHNIHGVPSDRPALLAVNHPTAFVDPIFLTSFIDPPVYNMTRGDVFQKAWARRLMLSINMFPVYRKRDGYSERDRNNEVFEFCYQKLRERRTVVIYVEGEHHLDKRVRPPQKGIARIAFGAMERHGLDDLEIIPVGVNYHYGDRPRDVAMVNVGQPILVKPYFDEAKNAPGAAMSRLLADIENGLKINCLHLAHEGDDELAEQLLALHRSDHPEPLLPTVLHSNAPFVAEKQLLENLNRLPETEKSDLKKQTGDYFAALKKAGLEDFALRQPGWGGVGWTTFLVLFVPVFLAGWLTSRPVAWLARWAVSKVKKREFFGSVLMGAGFVVGMIYYPFLLLLAALSGEVAWVGAALLLPLLGWFSIIYEDVWLRWRAVRRAGRSGERAKLLALRAGIVLP
ncbi:MAG: 1-acyl-sn-glycerol-3-phosphate acyltransferase [Saprospiraceae bacterium]